MRRLFALLSLMSGASLLLASLTVGPALAQSPLQSPLWVPPWEPPRIEISGFGGWVHYDLERSLNGEIYGGRVGYNLSPDIGVEGQVAHSGAEAPTTGAGTTFWFIHGDALYHLAVGRISPFLAAGIGTMNSSPDVGSGDSQLKLDAGGGLKVWLNEKLAIRADYRSYWGKDDGPAGGDDDRVHDYVGTIGLSVGLGKVPIGPPDTDLDGVTEDLDLCANTPLGVVVDAQGCPVDNDGDGVADYLDQCSATPRGATVDEKGCPSDSDLDRVPDGIDQCPNTVLGALVNMEGCPTDTDGDSIFDGIDQCQGTPAGVAVDASGCPRAQKLDRKVVLHDITFESASSEIIPDSYPQLDEVIESLKAWPNTTLEIRGYADSKGTKKRNLELTQERAEAVRDYFVSHGIGAERLVARGYGEEDPIASNDTEEGRAQNRRVELHRTD